MCGAYLSSSDENCDHDGNPVSKHVFRRVARGGESVTGVKCAPQYKWNKLHEKVGDEWIGYEYLGTKQHVNNMLDGIMWNSVKELPRISMSLHAPNEVGENND